MKDSYLPFVSEEEDKKKFDDLFSPKVSDWRKEMGNGKIDEVEEKDDKWREWSILLQVDPGELDIKEVLKSVYFFSWREDISLG